MTKVPTKRSIWRRRATKAAIAGAVLYAVFYGAVALGYRTFLYPRPRSGLEPLLAGTELWRLEAEGLPVIALWGAPRSSDSPVIVFFHGNGQELVDLVPVARRFQDEGFGFLFVEYPGYGLAAGATTSEETIYRVAERALRELADRGIDNARIVLMGHSLGTGVAIEMATRGYGERVILVSPYTSMIDMVKRFAPILPVSTFVSDRFETLKKAPGVKQEVLVFHGDQDPLIPVEMGRAVAAALPHGDLVIIEGGTHRDLFSRKDDKLLREVFSFSSARERHANAPLRSSASGATAPRSGAGFMRAN